MSCHPLNPSVADRLVLVSNSSKVTLIAQTPPGPTNPERLVNPSTEEVNSSHTSSPPMSSAPFVALFSNSNCPVRTVVAPAPSTGWSIAPGSLCVKFESSVMFTNTPVSIPSLETYPYCIVSMTMLANPGATGSSIVPFIVKLPLASVVNTPNMLTGDAAEPGTFTTSPTPTTYPRTVISGIAVLFSTYCNVPETVTSVEPSLSYIEGDQVRLTTSISSGDGHASKGIHPRSSPPLPALISSLTSPHCARFAP